MSLLTTPSKQGFLSTPKNHSSRTAWGPFFERKTRKMSPYGGRLKRDFNLKTIGI
jgi:hypothetical protein